MPEERARAAANERRPASWIAAGVILAIWIFLAAVAVALSIRMVKG